MMEVPIHTNHQIPEALRKTLEALLQIVPADLVFCKDRCLYIVPGVAASGSLHDYKVLLEGADWNRTGCTWVLYAAEDIRKGIDSGRMFYNTVFTTQWLVYDNGRSALPLPLPLRVAQTERHGRETFVFGYRQSQTFYRCAASLTSGEEYGVAAFMLHQSVELLLRAFIIAVTGEEVKTHTLADLMKHTLRYAPGLQYGRTPSGAALHRLPERLEKAYTGGRYSPHFHIAPEMLPELSAHVALLQAAVRETFTSLVEAYGVCGRREEAVWQRMSRSVTEY